MDKAALVTGGSSGIGFAIASMLRENGFALTLAARTRAKVEVAAETLGAHAVAADVAKEEDCRRLVDEHRGQHGRLDVLVNSARDARDARRRGGGSTPPSQRRRASRA